MIAQTRRPHEHASNFRTLTPLRESDAAVHRSKSQHRNLFPQVVQNLNGLGEIGRLIRESSMQKVKGNKNHLWSRNWSYDNPVFSSNASLKSLDAGLTASQEYGSSSKKYLRPLAAFKRDVLPVEAAASRKSHEANQAVKDISVRNLNVGILKDLQANNT